MTPILRTFLLLLVPLVGLSQYLWNNQIGPRTLTAALVPYAPTIAALLAFAVHRQRPSFALRRFGWRYLLIAIAVPLLLCLPVYGLAWGTGLGGLAAEGLRGRVSAEVPLLQAFLSRLPAGITLLVISAAGEELAWRGFALPELLKTMAMPKAVLALAIVWSVFHFPIMFFGDYHSAAPRALGFAFFSLGILGGTLLTAWLRIRSGSVWPAILNHAAHNFWVQGIFDGLTVESARTSYWTTEFGLGIALAYGAVGIWCFRDLRAATTAGYTSR